MTKTFRAIRHSLGITAGIVLCLILLGRVANAQSEKAAEPVGTMESSAPGQVENRQSNSGLHLGRELAHESREAAGEDENAAFKHSAPVALVAKLTGLSLENAYWFCVLVNFAIMAGLVIWVLKKNLPGMFRNRSAEIRQALEEARQASAEANQRLQVVGARLAHLDAEIAEIRAAAEKSAAAEEARIKAAAEEDARKIVQSAEQEIATAAKAARRELTAYAAALAVSLAAKQMHVDAGTDQALVQDFTTQLTGNGKSRRDEN